ncbi:Polyketide cyclase / dehydrase and lipid transport [Lentzea fradiae]|uniref:Polyketide cyclase / dehydrase and lipid transport n=1 Tax=Lentzea fradiae TaxID=200378 RepID=A0A1G7TC66_9PSEU|nr:SRPBCC domain-containing protein [Lentzea fradiae]SDG32692.1 Polyketide cyclase / dehydrase and lipid transport [Lentzea fradiae]
MTTGTVRVRTTAPAAKVREALTSADGLRTWLAEHAHVDLEGGEYEFWGRYTPEGERGRQKLLGFDDTSVRFSWLLYDTEYTVEIAVEERDGETVVAVAQSPYPAWGTGEDRDEVLQTYWPLALANLVEHVEGRPVPGLCDFGSPEQRYELDIAAAPAAVLDALTDPEVFARWFGARMEIEPHVGGRWAMGSLADEPNPAKVVALDEERLALEFPGGMVASWELEGSEGKTRLTFVQSGFDPAAPPYGPWLGWLSGFADLRRMLELPDWRPMWHSFDLPGLPDGVLVLE